MRVGSYEEALAEAIPEELARDTDVRGSGSDKKRRRPIATERPQWHRAGQNIVKYVETQRPGAPSLRAGICREVALVDVHADTALHALQRPRMIRYADAQLDSAGIEVGLRLNASAPAVWQFLGGKNDLNGFGQRRGYAVSFSGAHRHMRFPLRLQIIQRPSLCSAAICHAGCHIMIFILP